MATMTTSLQQHNPRCELKTRSRKTKNQPTNQQTLNNHSNPNSKNKKQNGKSNFAPIAKRKKNKKMRVEEVKNLFNS